MAFDVNNAAQVTALANEIRGDPRGYGYATEVEVGNDAGVALLLNMVRDTIVIRRPDVPSREIIEAIDIRHFTTAANLPNTINPTFASAWFESLLQQPTVRLANVDGSKTVTRQNIDRLVTDLTASQTRLDAIAIRTGSRAEELFGAGTYLSYDHVAKALRG